LNQLLKTKTITTNSTKSNLDKLFHNQKD